MQKLIYNVVITPAASILIGSSSFLKVTKTYIKAWMSSNFGQIPSLSMQLAAFEHLKIIVSSGFLCNFIQIFLLLAGNENSHKILCV